MSMTKKGFARSESRVVDHDPLSGTTTYWHYDGATEETTVENVEDVEPLIEVNKARYNADYKPGSEFRLVASIPNTVMDDLYRKGIAQDPERFKKWLNDRENLVFRCRPGRI